MRRSGAHEEIASDPGEENGADEGQRDGQQKKKRLPERVYRYMYKDGPAGESSPMFVIAYEELYDSTLTKVLALRVWKLVRLPPRTHLFEHPA